MPEAVLVAAARSPIGRAFKGSFVDYRPDDLAGFIVKDLLRKVPALDPADVVDVIFGSAVQVGEQGMNEARNIALLAGLPDTVPGTSVNRFCATSLQSIRSAFHAIKAGEGEIFIAGGVEGVSRTAGRGFEAGDANPRFTDESRADFVNHVYMAMGLTAENVAEQFDVSRQRMDEFAKLSQDRAVEAQKNGFFEREITPVELPNGTVVSQDDCPRPNTTLEKLAALEPAFKPDGRVTAGNACPLNDGAAAVLIMSEDRARSLGVIPLARIVASAVSGLAPEIMGVGPIEAVRKVLVHAGMTIGDIDVVELNEAFAAQVLPVCEELGISID
uniref:acetyl-CoA C-acyltransferase n=1 Tax=Cellulosimicrobium sp. KWT-B TaxID=1981152 RepID=UPI000A325E9E